MPAHPTTLVLSSGGVRGVAHAGALAALAEAGWLGRVRTFVGSSAGAIVGMLLVLGYTAAETERLARDVDLAGVMGDLTLVGVMKLPSRLGAVDGAAARIGALLRTLVARSRAARGDAGLTFAELRRRTGKRLVVCASDVSSAGVRIHADGGVVAPNAAVFCPDTTPDVAVLHAVRASCAIPLIFMPVDGHLVDGALVDIYPFDRSADERTLGVLIVDRCEEPRADGFALGAEGGGAPLFGFVRRLLGAVAAARASRILADPDIRWKTIVVGCDSGEHADSRASNLAAGRKAARDFVADRARRGVLGRLTPSQRADLDRCVLRARARYGRGRARHKKRRGAKEGGGDR